MRSKNACQKSEILLARKKLDFASPNNLPISFKLDGVEYKGIPVEFEPKVKRRIVDSRINMYEICGKTADGIEINVEYTEYRDYPVVEWTVFFKNNGTTTNHRLSDLKCINHEFEGVNPVFVHSTGDSCTFKDYEPIVSDLSEPVSIAPQKGRPCDGAYPYMRFLFDGFGYNIAIGWPGQWKAEAAKSEKGVLYTAGQEILDTYILPGETFRSPRITVMLFEGNETRGINLWRRWFFDHVLICPEGAPLEPKYVLHNIPERPTEFCFATEEQQITGMQNYLDRGYRPDIWWIDAGWYKKVSEPDNWCNLYEWEAVPEHFPNGLYPVGKMAEDNGISFLLWFEPECVRNDAWLYSAHTDWMLRNCDLEDFKEGYTALFDLTKDEAVDWLIDYIDSKIKKYNVKVYRQDYNLGPLEFWRYNEHEGRMGAIENGYVQGYLKFWDGLTERNPGLWIDSCSSGGRRNDLETIRRSVPLHYTDYGYGVHPMKQAQYRMHYEWVPYFRGMVMSGDNDEGTYEPAGNKPIDEYAYHVAFGPAITNYRSCYCTNQDEINLDLKMDPIWRKAAEIMLKSDFYLKSEIRKSTEDWCVWQFNCPEEDLGYVHAVRNTRSPDESFIVKLDDLDANARYKLDDLINGREMVMLGSELMSGLEISLEKRSGVIWFYEKI